MSAEYTRKDYIALLQELIFMRNLNPRNKWSKKSNKKLFRELKKNAKH